MTELYLAFLAQSTARDLAYSLIGLLGIGLSLNGLLLNWLLRSVFSPKLAARFLAIYAGGVLLTQMAGLVILPFLNLD